MSVFSSDSINKFLNDGEQIFAGERPCIIDRISLPIISGTALYELPSYLVNIRRITYKGWKLFPLPHRDLRKSFMSGTQGGRPYWYVFNTVPTGTGTYKIKLFPVPEENISATSDYPTLWGSAISTKFIVEFFRMPDPSDTLFNIPIFLRRRLLKNYINARCNQIDGKTNNLKAAKYWYDKFESLKQLYSEILDNINNKPRNLIANNQSSRPYGFTPPSPILPVNRYGISVDDITG